MNIELRKVKIIESLSEETIAFTAEVWADGVLCAWAKNEGHGGPTDLTAAGSTPDKKAKNETPFEKASAWCESLPDEVTEFGPLKMNLESYVDNLIYKIHDKKEAERILKKLSRLAMKSILICKSKDLASLRAGKPVQIAYSQISFSVPLDKLPVEKQLALIEKQMSTLKPGEEIFNALKK